MSCPRLARSLALCGWCGLGQFRCVQRRLTVKTAQWLAVDTLRKAGGASWWPSCGGAEII
ncbi:hypothetical protein BIFGAL_02935 [Bifidobacterium gallicum DSM 20093 = LMG 11596]|uniref:Uncharacterized protein n=1 Tax=Bifidobacterium gallicum DSM 20093 = LMG 11596 TaxID=561180 RepID=D1NT24_9BIFI|nr:hypothetical protein BIFGAL_02935 [Bifidobacterium gallicum DSM 20093 = LMG 11596]